MNIEINFNAENINRRLKEYDLYFFEIAIDHASFKEKYFRELVKKWDLSPQFEKKGTKEDDVVTYCNAEYSLAITGLNENGDDIPFWYISLTISKDMKLKDVIEFLRDFIDSLYDYQGPKLAIGINQNDYIGQTRQTVEKMILNLK
jgi:hypothetical protein